MDIVICLIFLSYINAIDIPIVFEIISPIVLGNELQQNISSFVKYVRLSYKINVEFITKSNKGLIKFGINLFNSGFFSNKQAKSLISYKVDIIKTITKVLKLDKLKIFLIRITNIIVNNT